MLLAAAVIFQAATCRYIYTVSQKKRTFLFLIIIIIIIIRQFIRRRNMSESLQGHRTTSNANTSTRPVNSGSGNRALQHFILELGDCAMYPLGVTLSIFGTFLEVFQEVLLRFHLRTAAAELLKGWMPSMSPNQQCQSILHYGKNTMNS